MSGSARIGFLGAGKMASALARGWLRAGLITREHLLASDPFAPIRAAFSAETEVHCVAENCEVVAASEVLILAVKPQVMPALLVEIAPALQARHLLISIAAGISLRQLREGTTPTARIIRVMPNTPCLVGASASGFTAAPTATADDVALVERLLNAVGKAYQVPESLLDAITGLSGSGPAFVAVIIEALADGGVRVGLPREVAQTLAAQTVLGTAKMILDAGIHPALLKEMVSSPGGTTIAGLHALERGGVRAALMDTVEAATRRARELGGSS